MKKEILYILGGSVFISAFVSLFISTLTSEDVFRLVNILGRNDMETANLKLLPGIQLNPLSFLANFIEFTIVFFLVAFLVYWLYVRIKKPKK